MEKIQILPSVPQADEEVMQMEGEPYGDDLNYYLRDTIASINGFTDCDTGFPLSTYDHSKGSFDYQTPHTELGDIGRSLLSTVLLSGREAMAPLQADHRIHQILAILESVFLDPDCYQNGLFVEHLRPDGLRNTEFERRPASPEQHALLLKGLGIVNGMFTQWQGLADELTKKVSRGINQSGTTLPDLDNFGEIPDRTIEVPSNIMRPADIMRDIVDFPAATFQRLRYLREQYPGIYLEGLGFMHEVNTETGEVDSKQYFKEQYEIVFFLLRHKNAIELKEREESDIPDDSNDVDEPEFESELLQVA